MILGGNSSRHMARANTVQMNQTLTKLWADAVAVGQCVNALLFAVSESIKQQYEDNCRWIREAGKHQLVSILNTMICSFRDGKWHINSSYSGSVQKCVTYQYTRSLWLWALYGSGMLDKLQNILVSIILLWIYRVLCTLRGTQQVSLSLHLQVVGSQARILYSNEEGRVSIALAFNRAVAEGRIKVQWVHTPYVIVMWLSCDLMGIFPLRDQ